MSRPPRVQAQRLDSDWIADAACAQFPALPWIERPGRVPQPARELMEKVCSACPVLVACEDFTHRAHITAGFWAGASRNHLEVSNFEPAHTHDNGVWAA